MTRNRLMLSVVAPLLVGGLALGVAQAREPGPGAGGPGTQGGPGGHAGKRMSHEGFLQKHLGLSEDQAKQVKQIREQQAEARRRNMQALHEANRELRQLVLNGGDEAAVRAKQTEVSNLMAESLRLRIDELKQIAPLLTPEQRQKFAQMGEGGPRRGGHGGPGRGPRPQGTQS
jgi:Spy/CpxP family protein refolding chaperone